MSLENVNKNPTMAIALEDTKNSFKIVIQKWHQKILLLYSFAFLMKKIIFLYISAGGH